MSRFDGKEKRTLTIFIFIFVLLAAGIAIGGILSYRNFEQQFRAQIEHQLSVIAKLKASELSNWRKERLADAGTLRQNTTFAELAQAYFNNPQDVSAQTQIQTWLESYQVYGYDRVRLLDTQGKTILSAPTSAPPISSVVAQHIPEVLQSKQVVMVDFYYSDINQRIDLAILIPILNSQSGNQVIGLVSFIINPQTYLYPFINEWPSDSTTAETLLIRRDGNDALFLNPLRFNPNAALTLRFPLTDTNLPAVKAVLGQTGVIEGIDYRGKQVLADVRSVPDSPWFLVSKMDIAEVYAPLRERLSQIIILVGMAICVAGAGLVTAWRRQRLQVYRAQAEAAEALRKSEIWFRSLFEKASDGIFYLSVDGVVVTVNESFARMHGYSVEEMQKINMKALEAPETARQFAERMRRIMAGEIFTFEVKHYHKDGHTFPLEVTASVITVGDEKYILAFHRDITERKQAEAALRQAEEKYRTIFENAITGIYQSTPAGIFLTANPALAHILGYDSPEELTAGLNDLNRGFYVQAARRAEFMRQLRDHKTVSNFESQLQRKDGSLIWISENAKLVRDAQGQEHYEGTLIDITERKQMENMIEARLRLVEFSAKHSLDELLVKTLDEACAILDSPIGFYHFVEADQKTLSLQAWSTRTMQEYCKAEGKGLHYPVEQAGVWADCVRQRQAMIHNDYASLPAAQRKGLPEGHAALSRELVVPILREDWIVAILGVGNKAQEYTQKDVDIALYFADIAWEIAERKRAEQQLASYTEGLEEMVNERTLALRNIQEQLVRQERLATLGQLAGSIGHELRNPLGVISNAIYFLKMAQPQASDKVKEYLSIIENEARTSGKIITDLLDYTRIKSVDREPASVSDLIRQALERFPAPASVEVTLEIPTDLPLVFADPQQVVQVLGNLVVNACQAMPSGGKLLVSSEQLSVSSDQSSVSSDQLSVKTRPLITDDWLLITIRDTGAGISPENRSKLFEPLFTTKTKGIGLGLAVSRKLIEANGGKIEVESEAGAGSTFTIWLPIQKQ